MNYRNNKVLAGHLAMLTANVAWGLMSPMSKSVMMGEVSALALVTFRMVGAAGVFWLSSLWLPREKVPRKDLLLFFVAALFAIVFNQGVFMMGISHTSPINASIVTTTLPLITMLIAFFYLKEPITWKKMLGIAIGGAGAVIIIVNSQLNAGGVVGDRHLLGITLCFAAQFSYALYFVLFKGLVSRYSPVTLMKWMFLFAACCYLPFSWQQVSVIDYSALPAATYGNIIFIVLGSTWLTYLLLPTGQKYLRPTVASMYNNVQPIVATVVAVLWQLDVFNGLKALAILLVVAGVYLVNQSKAREAGQG